MRHVIHDLISPLNNAIKHSNKLFDGVIGIIIIVGIIFTFLIPSSHTFGDVILILGLMVLLGLTIFWGITLMDNSTTANLRPLITRMNHNIDSINTHMSNIDKHLQRNDRNLVKALKNIKSLNQSIKKDTHK